MSDNIEELYEEIRKVSQNHPSIVAQCLKSFYTDNVEHKIWEKQVQAIPAIIYGTHVEVVINGVNKQISIQDFKQIVSSMSSLTSDTVGGKPLALPYGCFLFDKVDNKIYINCYYNETIAKVYFSTGGSSKVQFKIPLPNVITSFILKKVDDTFWQVESSRYFSTDKTVTQLPDTKFINEVSVSSGVYRLSLPNMYGDCRMCFGGNTMPVRFSNNLRGLDYYYQLLTLSPFNGDLSLLGVTHRTNNRDWLEHLSGLKQFPYDLLTK